MSMPGARPIRHLIGLPSGFFSRKRPLIGFDTLIPFTDTPLIRVCGLRACTRLHHGRAYAQLLQRLAEPNREDERAEGDDQCVQREQQPLDAGMAWGRLCRAAAAATRRARAAFARLAQQKPRVEQTGERGERGVGDSADLGRERATIQVPACAPR